MDNRSENSIISPDVSPSTSHDDGRIKPLPPKVVAEIKSSITVTSLNSVVFGLLENALDAGATKIEIQVDPARGSCIIEDDGLGIHPTEFGLDGGLAKMHRQSFRRSSISVASS